MVPCLIAAKAIVHNGCTMEDVFEEEHVRYQRMHDFAKSLGDEWFFFTYENMVAKNSEALNGYLGFSVQADAEVPQSTARQR